MRSKTTNTLFGIRIRQLERGGQDFNVFNLDPFVWFVHVKLGFSGYGFSVDDDKADIGSDGQSQLQFTIAANWWSEKSR